MRLRSSRLQGSGAIGIRARGFRSCADGSEQQRSAGHGSTTSASIRSPSSYPGRASAKATCAWRHLRCEGAREPPIPESSEAPSSAPRAATGKVVAHPPLLFGRARKRRGELGILLRGDAPALDSAGSLDPRDRRHEVRAREVVRRRERLALRVVRQLLGHRGKAVRATNGDPAERTRRAPQLTRDDRSIVHEKEPTGGCPSSAQRATPECPSPRRGALPASRS